MRAIIYLTGLLLITVNALPQDWPLKKLVEDKKLQQTPFPAFDAFIFKGSKTINGTGSLQQLEIKPAVTRLLFEQKPDAIRFLIPLDNNETILCELIKADLGNVRFTENKGAIVSNVITPLCYRGIVPGVPGKNTVALTVTENEICFNAVFDDKDIRVAKANESTSGYLLLNSKKVDLKTEPFQCGTIKEPSIQAKIAMQQSATGRTAASQDKCVYVFVDCFDSLYQWRNSNFQQTIDYVFALFNNVAAGYLNEQINIKISTINVWTTADPYRGDTRENALADLAANYQDNFWGNICVGLDFSIFLNAGRSGIAGDIGRVKGEAPNNCPAYTVADHPFIYADMNYNVNVQNFPTATNVTQQQVYLVMHEIGHLMGSSHTHWCGWLISTNPNVFGALDNCAAVEGTCAPGPAPPSSGGTIMSYCVSGALFVNYNNGFGTIPGNTIRNFVSNNGCIPNCSSCTATAIVGNLGNGPNHFEVSNTITANGVLPNGSITVFDAGVRVNLMPGFIATNGSNVRIIIDGCGGIR